jgi:ribonuclease HI
MIVKKKFYVVWEGRICGVFEDWAVCKAQIEQFQGAKYKSFDSKIEAEKAFRDGYLLYYKTHPAKNSAAFVHRESNAPILNSLSVDAACNMVTKEMEYQGVLTATKQLIFKKGPFYGASNNIGEFLALVHGLALLKSQNSTIPIYSDSITAIAWVRQKKHKSMVLPTEDNQKIFNLLQRAEFWLLHNSFSTPIYKWNTADWGEIPADFGRK